MTSAPLAPDAEGRAELYRLLAPIVDDVGAAAADPPAVAAEDWLGPASEGCRLLESELRSRLVTVLDELDRALAAGVRAR